MPDPAINAQRFSVLEDLGLLDASPDPALDRFVRAAAAAAAAPMALVTFLGPDCQINKARFGIDDATTPLADAFCVCALDSPGLLEVHDALLDGRFARCELVTGPAHVRAYAGQPIVFGGIVLGTVCVMDVVARVFEPSHRRVLADLSGIVADLLNLRLERKLRQRQEQRATDCAAAAGEWLWETDAEHRVSWLAGRLDDATAQATGDRLGHPPVDRDLLSWLGRPQTPRLTLWQLLERRQPFGGAVSAVDTAAARLIERTASPFHDQDNRFLGFRGSCRDVTDRVRAEVLAVDADAARRASRSKSEFLSRVSHELRTPLNAILGFGQLMLIDDTDAGRPTPVQRARLDLMRVAGEQLLSLVNDMLDLGRIEQGRIDVALRPYDLHRLIDVAVGLLHPLCAEHGVSVRNLVQPGQCSVLADERALGQVLLNLMSNAIKYNRHGGLVSVRAEAHDVARLMVEDNGPGMSAEQIAGLFQPFNRVGAETTAVAGSGLGLVVSKALVERMQGQIQVRSVVGVGTAVEVVLPRAADPHSAGEPAPAAG